MAHFRRTVAAVFALVISTSVYSIGNNSIKEHRNNKDNPVQQDTISQVAVVAHIKQRSNLRLEPISSSAVALEEIQKRGITDLHDLSHYTPNLYIPDYGSRMTSSIYIRGLGSRIDNAAVGLYVDRVPYMNKNGFDTDLWDIARMEVLRGPQSTLYGRNTIGGIINVYTLSPMSYEGVKIKLGYSNGNTYTAKASLYHKFNEKWAFSIGGNFTRSDGFFKNSHNNTDCDWIEQGSGRARIIFRPNSRLTFDNTFSFSRVREGGYAYGLFNDGITEPVNYNDESSYQRNLFSNGLSINYDAGKYLLSSVTTWQYLDDCLILDQDFTPKSMFTLKQAQREHTITQEFVFKRKTEKESLWHHMNGASLFYKNMDMDAPVLFKQDGIDELILGPANKGIQQAMPFAKLSLKENEFEIPSIFNAPVFGAGIYHQSEFRLNRFTITAGIRVEYEHSVLDYRTSAKVNYMFNLTMKDFKEIESILEGKEKRDYFEPLPKIAFSYSLGEESSLYASLARGFKAGGYNTQIFSDILQNKLQSDMMADLFSGMGGGAGGMGGGHTRNRAGSGNAGGMGSMGSGSEITPETIGEMIAYKPEYSWNYEVGGHFNFLENALQLDAALFFIRCTDQQLTVFPKGTNTGRVMTNAGKTNSMGAELQAKARIWRNLDLNAAYGYTMAKFRKYDDGDISYKGNYVPYVPQHTISAIAEYSFYNLGKALDRLSFGVTYNGIGKIYWNEENTQSQKFYSLLGASMKLKKDFLGLEFWGKNLTDTDYNAFYFVSVGNAFFSKGKPAQYGVTLSLEF